MNLNLIFKEQTLKFNKKNKKHIYFYNNIIAIGLIFLKEMILQGRDKVTQRLVTSMHRENLVKAHSK